MGSGSGESRRGRMVVVVAVDDDIVLADDAVILAIVVRIGIGMALMPLGGRSRRRIMVKIILLWLGDLWPFSF
jgi:hypothetical protein